ncbi:MAG: GNAT family N-acetyltransferase [Gemmatimonadota bacterium]
MPTVSVERTYLRLAVDRPLSRVSTSLPTGVRFEEASPCPVALYRRLYAAVGEAYHWLDRLSWSDGELAAHLGRQNVRLWVLRDDAGDGGFFELMRHDDEAVEIAYFGLVASRHGRGLGRAMLARAIDEAWKWGAASIWLHTCTLDGPQALPNYLARGFLPFRREQYEQMIADP